MARYRLRLSLMEGLLPILGRIRSLPHAIAYSFNVSGSETSQIRFKKRERVCEVDTVFCQGPKTDSPHRCGNLEPSRTVKTKASAREPRYGGAPRISLLSLACGLDSPCFSQTYPAPTRNECGVTLPVPPLLSAQTLTAHTLRRTPALSSPPPMPHATTSALPHTVPPSLASPTPVTVRRTP